jgi:hypothetical protein
MRRMLSTLAILPLAACLPPAGDAGEVDPTESSSTTGGGTEANDESSGTAGAPADAAFEWTLEIEPDLYLLYMVRTPDGILVSFQSDPSLPEPYSEVREYSSSMELLWSQTLPNAAVSDLEVVGDGEFLVAGVSGATFEPTVWRLSCCSEMTSQTYPHDSEYASIAGADLHEDGLLLAIRVDGSPFEPWTTETTFLQVPLELGPATELAIDSVDVGQTARAPSGSVVLLMADGLFGHLSELGPEGVEQPIYGINTRLLLVGKGDELTVMSLLEDEVRIQPFGGRDALVEGEWVSVSTPGFAAYYDEVFAVDRHERLVLVHTEDEPDGSSMNLVEFDDDGVVARSLIIPHQQYAYSGASAVAVGEDDAIYVAVGENDLEGSSAQYIHRIAAL